MHHIELCTGRESALSGAPGGVGHKHATEIRIDGRVAELNPVAMRVKVLHCMERVAQEDSRLGAVWRIGGHQLNDLISEATKSSFVKWRSG